MATRQFYPLHIASFVGSADQYLPIDGRGLSNPIFSQAAHPWAAAGVARHLRVALDDAPGAGQTRTVQVLVDSGSGPVAVLTVTFTQNQTELAVSGSEAIAEGATVCLFHTATGNPSTTRARVTVTVDYDDDGVSCYGGGGALGNGGHNTGPFSSAGTWSLVGAQFSRSIAPAPGTIDRLRVNSATVVPAGETLSISFTINGAGAGTFVIPEGESALNETPAIAFVAEDRVLIHATPSWTVSGAFFVLFGIRVTGEDGVSFLCSRSTVGLPGANVTRYTAPRQGGSDVFSTESPATVVGGASPFVLRHLYVRAQTQNLSVSPIAFTARVNGVGTALAVTTPHLTVGQAATVSDLVDEITVNPTDRLAMQFITGSNWFQGLLSFAAVVEAFASDEDDLDDDLSGVLGPLRWIEWGRVIPEIET